MIRLFSLAALTLGIGTANVFADLIPDAERALRELIVAPAVRGARVGVVVIDLETGERVIARNPDQLMVPASNQKLLIASAALDHWGPAHRFETPIYVAGELMPDGELRGTLWILGTGDPTLTSESLWKLAEDIRLAGVVRIRGGIGVDVGGFDGNRFHPDWEPISKRAYHAPNSAFAVNYSSFRITVRPGPEVGWPAVVSLAPFTSYLRSRSDVRTAAKSGGLNLSIEPLPDGSGERVRLSGNIAVGGKVRTFWRRVEFPERYALAVLRTQLETQGVRVTGSLRVGQLPADARELLRFEGEPLGPIIWKLNKFSNNFIAEQLTKALGADVHGPPGSWGKGVRAIQAHLRGLGIPDRSTVVADGSGLSPRNRVSAATLARVMRDSALRFAWGAEFLASLPLGGLDGTLADRLNGDSGPVRGKTGHLRHVASLSGLLPAGARTLVFSIIVNGARGGQTELDAAIDRFVAAIGDGAARQGLKVRGSS